MQTSRGIARDAGLALLLASVLLGGCATTETRTPAGVGAVTGAAYAELLNDRADFRLSAWSEQDPAHIGELLQLKLRSSAPLFLSLYEVSTSGRTARLFEKTPKMNNLNCNWPFKNAGLITLQILPSLPKY